MLSRIKQTDESVPVAQGWDGSTTPVTVEGQQYPIHCRRRDEGEALDGGHVST